MVFSENFEPLDAQHFDFTDQHIKPLSHNPFGGTDTVSPGIYSNPLGIAHFPFDW
ncbi:MAG: hypothetical protein ACE5NJ_08545 [Thermodesulfobacteriota bacterium]